MKRLFDFENIQIFHLAIFTGKRTLLVKHKKTPKI